MYADTQITSESNQRVQAVTYNHYSPKTPSIIPRVLYKRDAVVFTFSEQVSNVISDSYDNYLSW